MANEQIKSAVKLGGLNLRQEPADLSEHDLSQVSNFDPYRTPGTLTVRRGTEAMLDGVRVSINQVRQIARVNGYRFQVGGRRLYRDGIALTGDVFDPELETNFVGFRPLTDSAIWALIADDAVMLKDDGERTYRWGLETLPEPGPKVANQTGKVSGDTITAGRYGIAVTQIRWDLEG